MVLKGTWKGARYIEVQNRSQLTTYCNYSFCGRHVLLFIPKCRWKRIAKPQFSIPISRSSNSFRRFRFSLDVDGISFLFQTQQKYFKI